MEISQLPAFYKGAFTDKRIDARANLFLESIINQGSSIVNKCATNHSCKMGAYRLLNNQKCSLAELTKALTDSCLSNAWGKEHLLCIEDTTELSFTSHLGRIGKEDQHIGPGSTDSNAVFFCHPMLVIDAHLNMPIGFSSLQLWNRQWDKQDKDKRKYPKQPIEAKESFRWINAAIQSGKNLPQEAVLTVIADRESDIYQALCVIPQGRTQLLIRSSSDRLLCGTDKSLLEQMQSGSIKHSYQIQIKGNKSRKSRTAQMDLRFEQVTISRPERIVGDYPPNVQMNCIYVVEQPQSVPEGESAIEWRL